MIHPAQGSSSNNQQPSASAIGKRKRSSPPQAVNITPPNRQSTGRPLAVGEATPSKRQRPPDGPHPGDRDCHNTPISSTRRDKTSSTNMYSFDRRQSNNSIVDITSSPTRQDVQRIKTSMNKAGPRKLVVKNLRAETAWDAEKYLDQTWIQLDTALTKIFGNQLNSYSIDQLYTGVANLCRQGKGSTVYSRLKARCQNHLKSVAKDCLSASDPTSHVSVLRVVIDAWQSWQTQLTEIRRIFCYLDRSYVLQNQKPSLHELGLGYFNEHIFSAPKIINDCPVGICELIQPEREGGQSDKALIKAALDMEHQLAVYTESFEKTFLRISQDYIVAWAAHSTRKMTIAEYVASAGELFQRELNMCDELTLDSSTKRELLAMLEEHTIRQQIRFLSSSAMIAELLDADDQKSLAGLFGLLKRVQQTSALKGPFASWTEEVGTKICFDEDAVDQMIVRLLSLKRRLDNIWRIAFQRDGEIAVVLRDSFVKFINKTKKTSLTHNTDNSKTGEMIAKYVDMLLKGGIKAIPSELMATNDKENDDDDNDPNVDEDQKVSEQLEQVLDIFRFLHGKAVFEAFYKRDLAKRLLLGRSASADAEQNMLGRLKTECGAGFTQNLEQMFKDVELSREELGGYKDRIAQLSGRPGDLDLDVNILSSAAWPTYPEVPVKVPNNIQTAIDDFERYYLAKHSGRKLTWKHALANCQLNAKFPKGSKQMAVSSFQAIVLLLFNGLGPGEHLTYEQIQSSTSLPEEEVKRTLQSLACTKLRPLLKQPQGKDINAGDKFVVNGNFQHPKYRVRINQIQLKETKQENKETHERVAEDRNFECQAAVVRIMKSRKTIAHAELIAEVIKATQSRGVLGMGDIKKNIDKLIEKDYMEREEGNSYTYLA